MKPKTRVAIHISLYTIIAIVVAGSTFLIGYVARAAQVPIAGEAEAFSVFWEAWELVNHHFYGEKPNDVDRTRGAIKGSLALLDDPYTVYVAPQQRDREQEDLRGSFGGIGALVSRTQDGRILLEPIEGHPAATAGILEGDELVAVDDVPITPEMPFKDVLAIVRGQIGDIVRLTVRREGESDLLTFEVERAEIVTPSVSWELLELDIGYIRISMFNERTSDELQEAIGDLRTQGARAFVIDLRDNGGGLVVAAIDVASQFLKDGVVMYERKSSGEERPYPVKANGPVIEEPIAILINSATASASEIVAGAIQDYGRGTLIGTKTFGKASVQLLFDLSDGSSLHLTNAHWLTPSRNEIDQIGLAPDIVVTVSDQDRENGRDPQRQRAIELLHEGM